MPVNVRAKRRSPIAASAGIDSAFRDDIAGIEELSDITHLFSPPFGGWQERTLNGSMIQEAQII